MSVHTTTVLLLKRSILTEKIARRGHHGEARGGTTGELDGRVIGMVGYDDELAGHFADRMALAEIGRVPILNRKSGVLVGRSLDAICYGCVPTWFNTRSNAKRSSASAASPLDTA